MTNYSTGNIILDEAINRSADLTDDSVFDELVNDLKLEEASRINNEGYAAQLTYIASQLDASSALSEVLQALIKQEKKK